MCLSLSTIYLYLNPRPSSVNTGLQPLTAPPLKRLKAYILTGDCQSLRFNATRENIDRVFPFLFDVRCYLTIPLNDSRIHTGPTLIMKKFSSNLLAFVELWTYIIPGQSTKDPYEWSFIFEDDVNFINPTRVSLLSYNNALQQLMNDPEIQRKDGFIYLGICGTDVFQHNQNDRDEYAARCQRDAGVSQRSGFLFTRFGHHCETSASLLDGDFFLPAESRSVLG